ncbi:MULTISPECIES: lactonase family protein [Streptomyces]|uniref:Secreted protein n=1 Tax=Streptomyces sviceus (strain ATCC 29083 / DSM 924 / JCM 4929 / NBRC 13980 / NCIMB 11184 / NRRL 5439 / UC 5370) TaxID=463191 RepID=B5HZ54_STRX2|nr:MULTISPECIES: lactonase family protein [Streptomyces]EDY58109.1 secreted protein [Streptomyces sviceus ATCC 29083]MYT10178.1 beta-propeller fold lactonase family protein [Streptomyces sp. SID5470]
MSSANGGWSRRRFVGVLAGAGSGLVGCSTSSGPSSASAPSKPPASSGSASPSRTRTPSAPAPTGPRPLYLGTYTSVEGGGTGIGIAAYDADSGRITGKGTITGVTNPSYLAVHPDGRTLYAVAERDAGAVTAVRLSDRKVLGSRSTGGAGPCHLSVHPGGRWLLSANYGSGSVAVHPIDPSGALGALRDSVTHSSPAPGPGQEGPHAHQFLTSPDGGHVLAVDLGTDTVYSYRLDERTGALQEVSRARTRAGAGPRHLTFHPGGRYAYLANEVDNTVAVCAYDRKTGRVSVGAPQSTGTGSGTNYPAQFLVTANGSYAYLANRGDNSLTRYAVEGGGARLRLLDTVPVHGDFPRQIAFSPDGRLLFAANQRSGTVSVFRVDSTSGDLRLAGEPFASPVAVCALPL